jgi:hypothetical protein
VSVVKSIRCDILESVYGEVMSNIAINLDQPLVLTSPPCTECSGPTRLTGIEPHPTRPRTDLRTSQCLSCDAVHAVVVPITA